ncbi:MAG: DUF4230 domain-containing protein [Lachnospiraceae bacterium]|nr:DUF4230 domain-containing protein [Lachnospiraceae bacterium]
MKKKENDTTVYMIVSLVLLAVLAILVTVALAKNGKSKQTDLRAVVENSSAKQGKKLFDPSGFVKEEVTVNTEVIAEGLKDMGTLITQEYYFTQVEEYESTKSIWIFESEASFIYSYDGVVNAGIDCTEIKVDKDDEKKTVLVTIPKSTILNVVIDFQSFKKYKEKEGLWNKIDMTKYNDSLVEFEKSARRNAEKKGVLGKADENAKKLVESFVKSLMPDETYSVSVISR